MKIVVDNLITEYSRSGKNGAPLVLLLPGWRSPAANFAKLAAALAKNFAVLTVDFPGWPNADKPLRAWNMADYADWTAKFLAKVGATEIFAIIGHSFGGRVMLKGLASGQFAAQKLIFMDVAGIKPRSGAKAKLIKTAARLARILPSGFRQKIGQKFASDDYKSLGNNPILRATFSKIVEEDLTSLMPKIRAKSLLIWGRNDTETPLADAEVFANNLPDSHLEIIENAGHYVFLDQPDRVAKLIKDFLC